MTAPTSTRTPASRKRTRAAASDGLEAADLDALAAAVANGRRATVYLREATPSLGLDAGTSARVLSIDGTTVVVRPKGVDDQLPFEADELLATRIAVVPTPAVSAPAVSAPAVSAPTKAPVTRPARPVAVADKPVAVPEVPATSIAPASPAPKPRRTKTAGSAGTVSITVTSGPTDVWSIAVSQGAKKIGRPADVTPDRVARAVRELGDEAAIAVVDDIIESARSAAQRRVAELSDELESARAALARLDVK